MDTVNQITNPKARTAIAPKHPATVTATTMDGNDFDHQFYERLQPDTRTVVRDNEAEIDDATSKDAESTFRTGGALANIQRVLADTTFSEWCSAKWPHHRTYAYALIRVARELGPLRTRLINARVPRASLMDLSKWPDQAESVLRMFEGGQRLSVQKVKSLLHKTCSAASASPQEDERGGVDGLRQLHRLKGAYIPLIIRRIASINEAIHFALLPSSGRLRLRKRALVKAIHPVAQLAHRELRSICLHLEPDELHPLETRETEFAQGSRWGDVADVLFVLGGKEAWPPAVGLDRWLQTEVLPILRWATDDTQIRGQIDETEEEQISTCRPLPPSQLAGEMRNATNHDITLQDFARTRLDIDPFEFSIPLLGVKPGVTYDVFLGGQPEQWLPAMLEGGTWTLTREGFICHPHAVRLCDAAVRLAIDFLVYVVRYSGSAMSTEKSLCVAMPVAVQLLSIMAETSPDDTEHDAELRHHLAEALSRHCLRILDQDRASEAVSGCV